MKKKILFICPRFHTNLFYTVKLLKQKYYVEMLVANTQTTEDHSLLKPRILKASILSKVLIKVLFKFNKNNRFYFPKFLELHRYIKKNLPDLIILRNHNKIFGFFIITLAKLLGIKLVFYEQLGKNFFKMNKVKLLFYSIRNFLLNSKFYTPIFDNFKKDVFHYNFLHLPFQVEIKKKIKKKSRSIKLLFVGKFIPRKNLLLLIKIFSKLIKNYNLELYVIGEVSSKLHKNYLKLVKKEIVDRNILDKIVIIKNLRYKKIFKYYRLCDVLIMPSTKEPASISVLESLGQGTPVICSKNNGTSFYIKNKFNGLTFDENNTKDLTKKILFLVKSKKKIYNLSQNSYEYFKKNNSKVFFNQFEKLLK